MDKELCFNIENDNLYLEQVLVEYIGVPIFFLCKGSEQYYIVLCTNIDELNYIVAKLSLLDVYNLLHGIVPMRDVILSQSEYWDVVSGDTISFDIVTKKSINLIDINLLPETEACYKILNKDIEFFVQKFDNEFLATKYFSKSDEKVYINEWLTDDLFDNVFENVSYFVELADYKMDKQLWSTNSSYCEQLENIESTVVLFSKFEQSNQANPQSSFKLTNLSKNNITIAA